jgi:hypothetical protein
VLPAIGDAVERDVAQMNGEIAAGAPSEGLGGQPILIAGRGNRREMALPR